MSVCKIDGCREQAVVDRGWGHKRYCTYHGERYVAKKASYEAIKQQLRDCLQCGDKLSKTRHDNGEALCGNCATRNAASDAVASEERRREQQLVAATTLHEFKEWVVEWCQLRPLS